MGRGQPGDGVELRPNSVRIRFTQDGVRHKITLDGEPTRANKIRAQKLVNRIRQEIKLGTFAWDNYATEFPGYDYIPKPEAAAPVPTFSEYGRKWINTVTNTKSTRRLYKQTIENFWGRELGDIKLDELRHDDIATVLADLSEELSSKTLNNALIPLRRMLDAAVANKIIVGSPASSIRNLPYQKPTPDPFEAEEVGAILKHMEDHYAEQVWAYYEFAFNTGLRPSEQIAAKWGSFDKRRKTLHITNARVLNQDKDTKTHKGRVIDLSEGAMHALRTMKKHTFMRGVNEPIFCDPITGQAWPRIRELNTNYFQPVLRALQIRQRRAYNTRHTFASLALTAGVNVAYISGQLGHTSAVTTLTYYAKWIRGADGGAEAAKLSAALNPANWPAVTNKLAIDDF
jgi:integrase